MGLNGEIHPGSDVYGPHPCPAPRSRETMPRIGHLEPPTKAVPLTPIIGRGDESVRGRCPTKPVAVRCARPALSGSTHRVVIADTRMDFHIGLTNPLVQTALCEVRAAT